MSLWNNMGITSCPAGQRYSSLLGICVADDTSGTIVTTPGGEVMVNDGRPDRKQGQFWEKAPDYIDSLAGLWSAIKGRPVQAPEQGGYGGQYPQQKDNSSTVLLGIFGLILLLIVVFLLLRRK